MNQKSDAPAGPSTVDPKVAADWAAVESRRAELNSRSGGDTRRQAIMRRIHILKNAS